MRFPRSLFTGLSLSLLLALSAPLRPLEAQTSSSAVLAGSGSGNPPRPLPRLTETLAPITKRICGANRLQIQLTDRGGLDYSGDGVVWWYGADYPEYFIFDHGPWVIGKIDGKPALGAAYWRTTYAPGPVINGRPALDVNPADSLRYHPYWLSRSASPTDPDLLQWPGDLGAPVDARGRPQLLGDELVWAVFNGIDSTAYCSDLRRPFTHIPVEIRQSVYERSGSLTDTAMLSNCAFMEWTFINKGTSVIESCYVGLWSDLDVHSPWANPFGIDTTTQTGYCWDSAPGDTSFGPKAAGYTWLYGPVVPDPAGHAVFQGKTISGYHNLPLSSFWGIRSDFGGYPAGPATIDEAWNIARGYDTKGGVVIDSVTKLPTRFPWAGDPLTGAGMVFNGWTNGEAGLFLFSGPFTLAPGDTQWAMAALVAGAGKDFRDGIRTVRSYGARLRSLSYEQIAMPRTMSVDEQGKGPAVLLPAHPALDQNYPNPFNPATTIRFRLPERAAVRLAIYDPLGRMVAGLAEGEFGPGEHLVRFDAGNLSSGIYFCRLTTGSYIFTRRICLLR